MSCPIVTTTIKMQHSGSQKIQGKGLKGNSILSTLVPSYIYTYTVLSVNEYTPFEK